MRFFHVPRRRFPRAMLFYYYTVAAGLVLVCLLGGPWITTTRAAGGVISVCDQYHLTQAVSSGGSYTFSCSGTIFLSSTASSGLNLTSDLSLDATGQNVTIDGGQAHRIFFVETGIKLNLKNLTLTHGGKNNFGGAIFGKSGTEISIYNSTLSYNTAEVEGGAIYSNGTLSVFNSVFNSNSLNLANNTYGGAIGIEGDNAAASLTVVGGSFASNQAAAGGAIAQHNASVSIIGASFTNNTSTTGGAISNSSGSTPSPLTISNSTFNSNSATKDHGGAIRNEGGILAIYGSTFSQSTVPATKYGGAIFTNQATSLTNSTFSYNSTAGGGQGGAIFSHANPLKLTNVILTNNQAGSGGAISNYDSSLTVLDSTFSFNSATADTGEGGAVYSESNSSQTGTISRSTFNSNSAYSGGAIYNYRHTVLSIDNSTFQANKAAQYGGAILENSDSASVTSSSFYNNMGGLNSGWTLYNGTTLTLKNSIIALPAASSGGHCSGVPLTNGGNNLQWPGTTCPASSPITSADPKMNGNLGLNGGPTQTLALQSTSPAINAASNCATLDQRYAARQGTCDIGAYEYNGALPTAPGVTLAFNPASVTAGTAAQLVLTLHNAAAIPLTNLALSDNLSAQLTVAAVPNIQNSCSTPGTLTALPGTNLLDLYGLGLNAGETCTVKVAISGTRTGTYSNTTGNVSTAETGFGPGSNSASLTVNTGQAAQVTAYSGSGQSTSLNTPFANPLKALVVDAFGNPVSGALVTFQAPASGASAFFANSSNTYTAATDATGYVSVAVTANGSGGAYTVTAEVSGAAPASYSLTNLSCDNPNQVLSDHDNGAGTDCGTLSYALTHAAAGSAITFGPQVTKITITGVLPAPVAANLNIQGYCNYELNTNHGRPQVTLEGQSVNGPGLKLTGGMTVLGVAITGFTGQDGYALDLTGDNNQVYCTWLGTETGLNSPKPNTGGIRIAGNNNLIGSSNPLAGNLIGGNTGRGIVVSSGTNNTMGNNWIGLTKDGVTPLKNSGGGIQILAGSQLKAGPGNLILS